MTQEEWYITLAIGVLQAFESPHVAAIEACRSTEAKRNIINAIGLLQPELHVADQNSSVQCAYPGVTSQVAAKLVLGIPVGEGLTSAERHEWLTSGAKTEPHEWLLSKSGVRLQSRSVAVSRWLIRMCADSETKEALYARRRWGSLADHTIDLVDEDCTGGVREAIARREDRMAVDNFGAEKLCSAPKWLNTLRGRVRLLDTAPALAEEGRVMCHCVGGYAGSVKEGRSVIVAISAWGERATVEYDKNGKLIQIQGRANRAELSARIRHLAKLAASRPAKTTKKRTKRIDARA